MKQLMKHIVCTHVLLIMEDVPKGSNVQKWLHQLVTLVNVAQMLLQPVQVNSLCKIALLVRIIFLMYYPSAVICVSLNYVCSYLNYFNNEHFLLYKH